MVLALDFLTAIDLGPPELVSAAESTGCFWVSLLVAPVPILPDYGLLGDTPTRRETRRRCLDTGVAVDMIEAFR